MPAAVVLWPWLGVLGSLQQRYCNVLIRDISIIQERIPVQFCPDGEEAVNITGRNVVFLTQFCRFCSSSLNSQRNILAV